MKYQDAKKYIDAHNNKGIVLGLESIKNLLEKLDNPQNDLKIVHIAGTNGKGSTGAFLTYILANAGYRVGRYVSPAVFVENEIIQFTSIDSDREYIVDYIDENEIADIVSKIEQIEEDSNGVIQPTTFEIQTAMAFEVFKRRKCDIVVVECGMGGRLDATNIIEKPVCEIITSISMDHMNFLGDTIEKIALEKCGIIKEDTDIVSAVQSTKVLEIIAKVAEEKNARLIRTDSYRVSDVTCSINGTDFRYKGQEMHISLLGKYQINNAITAIETACVLKKYGFDISDSNIQIGLYDTVWKGRMGIVFEQPLVIVDGAHNEDAALKLKESIETYLDEYKIIMIAGAFADKETEKMMSILAPYAESMYTFEPDNKRAIASEILQKQALPYCKDVIALNDVSKALECAIKRLISNSKEKTAILCFGSLSFVKDVYRYFDK